MSRREATLKSIRQLARMCTPASAGGQRSIGAAEWHLTHCRWFAAQSGAPQTRGPVSYASLALTVATGAGLLYWYEHQKAKKMESLSSKAVVAGQAAIGGPFTLIEASSKRLFTDKNLHGRFTMLYFGFTHCPDICPEELEKVAEAVDLAAKTAGCSPETITPVFITVDPERDGPAQVQAYVKEFHPRMVGLTGSPAAVKEAAKAYRVYYTKAGLGVSHADTESDKAKQKSNQSEEEDYLVDHSIITYLLDPNGQFLTFYGRNYTAEEMAKSVAGHVQAWQQEHPQWTPAAKTG